MRGLHERPQKKVDVGAIHEFDVVEEVESAARVPGRADEGGLAPCSISMESGMDETIPACIDDLLADVEGKAAVVHVGE